MDASATQAIRVGQYVANQFGGTGERPKQANTRHLAEVANHCRRRQIRQEGLPNQRTAEEVIGHMLQRQLVLANQTEHLLHVVRRQGICRFETGHQAQRIGQQTGNLTLHNPMVEAIAVVFGCLGMAQTQDIPMRVASAIAILCDLVGQLLQRPVVIPLGHGLS